VPIFVLLTCTIAVNFYIYLEQINDDDDDDDDDDEVWITEFYLQITPYLPLPRKLSSDGAITDCGGGHLIVAHYSSTQKG